jgi:hypothetical protein
MIKNKKILAIVMLIALPFYALGVDKVTYGPGAVPLGGIVMVMPTTLAAAWQPPVSGAIKDGFMRADGATVPSGQGSPMQGLTLPNMTGYFPKGAVTSGTATAYGVAFSGTAAARSGWFGTTSLGATFTGTAATYSVSVPRHYHNTFSLTAAGQGGGGHTHTFGIYRGGGAGPNNNYGAPESALWGTGTTSDTAHTHNASAVSGTVGNQGGTNGDADFTASGSNTPSGGVSFPAANDNMADWSAAGSYTPAGTMSGDPATMTVVYVIRVK